MKKGFLTLTNENSKYKALVDVLVESVLEFTDLEIEVVGINFDYRHSNKRVLSKRMQLQPENSETIYYSKIKACMDSGFDVTMYLDSDIVVGPQIVDAFHLQASIASYMRSTVRIVKFFLSFNS